jgi:transposase
MAQPKPTRVIVGVDTHGDVHVACAIDELGRHLDTAQFPTTPKGYRTLLGWAGGLGEVEAFGVEGTGCYGAALARFLSAQDQVVFEVNRPDRQARRRRGKSDPVDAEAAARAVLAGQATAIPRAVTSWWRWCGVCGCQGHGGQVPQPSRQRPAGAAGDRPC